MLHVYQTCQGCIASNILHAILYTAVSMDSQQPISALADICTQIRELKRFSVSSRMATSVDGTSCMSMAKLLLLGDTSHE